MSRFTENGVGLIVKKLDGTMYQIIDGQGNTRSITQEEIDAKKARLEEVLAEYRSRGTGKLAEGA